MSFQKKYVLVYFCIAAFFILRHQHSFAQHVIPDTKLMVNVSNINNSLEHISKLQPKRFEYNIREYNYLKLPSGGHYGFLTEDFRKVMPHLVKHETRLFSTGKNTQQAALVPTVEMEKLVPLLVGAIQEQQAIIDGMKQEIIELKAKLEQ